MTLRKTLALSAAFVVAVALFGALSTSASAQAAPFTAYGTGATAGDEIGIWAGSTLCTTATVDSSGNWGPVQVGESLGDCSFADGDTISFSVNGAVADESETWAAQGAPADRANGTTLTVTAAKLAAKLRFPARRATPVWPPAMRAPARSSPSSSLPSRWRWWPVVARRRALARAVRPRVDTRGRSSCGTPARRPAVSYARTFRGAPRAPGAHATPIRAASA